MITAASMNDTPRLEFFRTEETAFLDGHTAYRYYVQTSQATIGNVHYERRAEGARSRERTSDKEESGGRECGSISAWSSTASFPDTTPIKGIDVT